MNFDRRIERLRKLADDPQQFEDELFRFIDAWLEDNDPMELFRDVMFHGVTPR